MKLVERSVCPGCSESTLAVIAFDSDGERETARCQECGHSWPVPTVDPV